ncbi:hypothetical protein Y032_0007g3413 [Ancylostoma ceylanicum]|uniref:Uncharacterized protein n=1 Tax=Ancylostoma ceylanicum TaxID=53326 RepID=A0A016VMD2_9BILA|nr:hypothetical protein Y032_0007g3413 [Ancylostoma ceylanicum]
MDSSTCNFPISEPVEISLRLRRWVAAILHEEYSTLRRRAPMLATANRHQHLRPTCLSMRKPTTDRHRWDSRQCWRRPVINIGDDRSPTSAATLHSESMRIGVTVASDGDAGCYSLRGL